MSDRRTAESGCCRPDSDAQERMDQQTLVYAAELRQRYEKDRAETAARRALRKRIRRAIEQGGMSMVYQPIVELFEGNVVGVEALARFGGTPQRSPDVWFAEAGEVGLGIDLELMALELALDGVESSSDPAYLSVNLSPNAVCSVRFRERLRSATASKLVIEVTEHTSVDDYDPLLRALDELRAAGGRLAIDDAGAGFASLRHILRLSPEFIKLDISLTRGIHGDRARRALASALISFAFDIGTTIVAEGIEHKDELDALRDLGVRYGQGYYFARPGPLAASKA